MNNEQAIDIAARAALVAESLDSLVLAANQRTIGADLSWPSTSNIGSAGSVPLMPVVLGNIPQEVADHLTQQDRLGWDLVYHYTDKAGNQVGIFKRR